jgi:hypothetical protein
VNINEPIPANACPICQRNDKVQKVSVIYMHGSHDTTMSMPVTEINSDSEGRTYSTTRHQQVKGLDETKLAQALHPPTKPEAPKPPLWQWYFIGGGVLVAGFCAPMFVFTIFGVLGRSPNGNSFGGLLLLSFIGFMSFLASSYSSANKNYKKKMADYNSSIFPSWKQSLEKWNSLYFCYRDGCVFKVGEKVKVSVPLEQMAEFIGWSK